MSNTALKQVSATTAHYDYDTRIANLTAEEKTTLLALTEKLDSHDLTTLQTYGSELSQVVAENGDRLLSSIKAENGGDVVALTTELLKQLNMIDINELNTNTSVKRMLRKLPILRKFVTSIENVQVKYNDIKTNVDAISDKMGDAKLVALKDNSTLQEIFDNNVQYIKRLRDLIVAAKLKNQEVFEELQEMDAHPENYEAYQIAEKQDFQTALAKRITDMEVTEHILEQNLLQIKATQANNLAIADKSDNIVTNVIPLWKNELSISLIMNNQSENVKAQQLLAETTNRLMSENAKNLHMNSVSVAKANEESVISLETLKTTTSELINTIKEVEKIHNDGTRQRELIENELKTMSAQLENAIKGLK